jgi:hypothetical protein
VSIQGISIHNVCKDREKVFAPSQTHPVIAPLKDYQQTHADILASGQIKK